MSAIGLIFLNLYSPARGIVTELCNRIWPGSDVSVLSNPTYAFWGITFTFILFGGANCLLLLPASLLYVQILRQRVLLLQQIAHLILQDHQH